MEGHFVLEGMGGITIDAVVGAPPRGQHDGLPHEGVVKNVIQVRGRIAIQINEALKSLRIMNGTVRVPVTHPGKT